MQQNIIVFIHNKDAAAVSWTDISDYFNNNNQWA